MLSGDFYFYSFDKRFALCILLSVLACNHAQTLVPSVAPSSEAPTTWDYFKQLYWAELDTDLVLAATLLGYDQTTWDNSLYVTTTCLVWSQLTDEEIGAAEVFGYTEERWNDEVSEDNPDTPCTYNWWNELYYDDLPQFFMDAAVSLGYDQVKWDEGDWVTTTCLVWSDLTDEQKEAAEVLGYTDERWDDEVSEFDPVTRCPYDWWNHLSFDDLPQFLMDAAVSLGHDQTTWDNGIRLDYDCDPWADLTPKQQQLLGVFDYTKERWTTRLLDCVENPLYTPIILCLSGYSQIQVLGKGYTFLNDVEQGDEVLVSTFSDDSSHEYQMVYLFGHQDAYAVSKILQITTLGNQGVGPLEITSDHLVFKQESHAVVAVQAGTIQVGDYVIGSNIVGEMVTNIAASKKPGLYSPITNDGKFVANGILVSSYTAINKQNPEHFMIGRWKIASHHFMLHVAITPYRVLCLASTPSDSFAPSFCKQPRNHEGKLLFVAQAEKLNIWMKQQSNLNQIVVAVLFFVFLVPLHVMEQLFGGFIVLCLSPILWLLGTVFLYVFMKQKKK